jgi:aryl-alcohol dehydrogenase-like predicted oxidoreductase
MRIIELCPGIRSSVLGFGCAPILGSVDGATARRALTVALDEGITHFDLARSYGYGDAERFLGGFLQGRRDRVVIATKFGITATGQARLLRPLKPLVRMLRKLKGGGHAQPSPALKPETAVPVTLGDRFHRRLAMEPGLLRASVEKSLRELRTDYLDYLFLHEPQEALGEIEGLAAEIAALKAAGKVRAWGLAYMRTGERVHEATLPRFDVLQYNLSPGAAGYDAVRVQRGGAANVFFSPFRGAPAGMPRDEVLRQLGKDFPRSVILCSMFNPEHIRANTRAI